MTRQELSQLYHLNREIEQLRNRLTELESFATSSSSRLTGMPRAKDVTDKVGDCAIEILELKTLLDTYLMRCLAEQAKLYRFIEKIDDSEMRQILSLRYVNGLSWQQVAVSMGEYDEQYPRKKHNRFLNKSILDEKDERSIL